MARAGEIRDYLFEFAPQRLAMDFDNVGLLAGLPDTLVTKALVSLDITGDVIGEAESMGAQLVVSHHPLVWDAMKSLTGETVQERKVMRLIHSGIAAICMHTNLDIASGGVNDALMARLGADTEGVLEPTGDGEGCGRVGEFENSRSMPDFLKFCKSALNANGLRYHDAGLPVKRIAVMGGSGGDCVALAARLGCDTYVTADVKYDQFLLAREIGINLIDADHFCTENVVVPVIRDLLAKGFPEVEFRISAVHCETSRFC